MSEGKIKMWIVDQWWTLKHGNSSRSLSGQVNQNWKMHTAFFLRNNHTGWQEIFVFTIVLKSLFCFIFGTSSLYTCLVIQILLFLECNKTDLQKTFSVIRWINNKFRIFCSDTVSKPGIWLLKISASIIVKVNWQ